MMTGSKAYQSFTHTHQLYKLILFINW